MKLGYSPWGNRPGDVYPFDAIFDEVVDLREHGVKGCDAILLWGGTDINPTYYGQNPHYRNGFQETSERDTTEYGWMMVARDAGIPIIGVCRGAQFICAFAGGTLYQDVSGHGVTHYLTVIDGSSEQVYQTSSSHHQMMNPFSLPENEFKVIGWCRDHRSNFYPDETGKLLAKPPVEPEVVLFPKIRALAIQGHPEWQDFDEDFVQWVLRQVDELVNVVV